MRDHDPPAQPIDFDQILRELQGLKTLPFPEDYDVGQALNVARALIDKARRSTMKGIAETRKSLAYQLQALEAIEEVQEVLQEMQRIR
jgi:hypothetical protein